jgi:1-acyl-sn-glycerol-3-phosphate acyltransferase
MLPVRTGLWTALLLSLLLCLALMSLGWNLIATLLYPLLPRDLGLRLGRAAISRCYRWFWALATLAGVLKLDSTALDRFRDEPGLIIAANHPSMMDALLLVARLPRSACIMKADLMKNIFLGAGARLARYIRNDSPRSMIRLAVQDLKCGGQVVIFPEGTRTTQRPINRFGTGVALIAKLSGAPIQAVFIDTDSPYLGKGWPIWRLPPLPVVFTVRAGERFAPEPDPHALQQRLEQYFAAGLKPRGS